MSPSLSLRHSFIVRLLTLTAVSSFFMMTSVLADNGRDEGVWRRLPSNLSLLETTEEATTPNALTRRESIILPNELESVLHRWRGYVCDRNIPKKQNADLSSPLCNAQPRPTLWASSPWLMDHLLDHLWRSLDGDIETQYPGVGATRMDIDGVTWRNYIQEALRNPAGGIPRTLENKFAVARGIDPDQPANGTFLPSGWTDTSCSDTRVEQLIGEWGDLGLAGRYYGACLVARCAGQDMGAIANPAFVPACTQQAEARIYAETMLVRQVMIENGRSMLNTQRDNYQHNLWTRAGNLTEELSLWGIYVDHMDNKIQEGTRICSAR